MEAANDNVEGKNCSKCLEWKPIAEFHTDKRKDGTRRPVAACKVCTNARNRANAAKNVAAAVERVRQWRLLPGNLDRKNELERARRKDPAVAAKNAEYNAAWKNKPGNRETLSKRRRDRRDNEPDFRAALLEKQREYYGRPEVKRIVSEKSKIKYATPEHKEKFNAYRRARYADDPLFALQGAISRLAHSVLRRTGQEKLDRSHAILGYSANQLRQRLECQFRSGMSWENRSEWHIDHKKPVAEFLRQGITDPKLINMLSNLQPLWAWENQAKSDTWPLVAANDNIKVSEAA